MDIIYVYSFPHIYVHTYIYIYTLEVIGFICRDCDDICSLLSNSNIKSLE